MQPDAPHPSPLPASRESQFPALDDALLAFVGAGRWRVLGRRLRPLTLLHQELLRCIGHGLVTGAPVSLVELDLAVRICAQDPFKAGRWLGRAPGRLRRFWEALRAVWLLLRWGAVLGRERAVMSDYLTSVSTPPEMMERVVPGAERGMPTDMPPLLRLVTSLAAAGFPYREVLAEWPCGLVDWTYHTVESRTSGSKFMTESDREIRAEIAKMQALTAEPDRGEAEQIAVGIMRRMRGR